MTVNRLFKEKIITISELNLFLAFKNEMISIHEYVNKLRELNNNNEHEVEKKIKMMESAYDEQ